MKNHTMAKATTIALIALVGSASLVACGSESTAAGSDEALVVYSNSVSDGRG